MLRFASTSEALQYLADYTGYKIKVAQAEWFWVDPNGKINTVGDHEKFIREVLNDDKLKFWDLYQKALDKGWIRGSVTRHGGVELSLSDNASKRAAQSVLKEYSRGNLSWTIDIVKNGKSIDYLRTDDAIKFLRQKIST